MVVKKYSVKEAFYTVQGEGANSGTPAVFIRFSGCNLWSGRELDRSTAKCRLCDTNFLGTDGVGGGVYTAEEIAEIAAERYRPAVKGLVVLTGGEPALQVDNGLIAALHLRGFRIAIETNGTVPLPDGIDWVCVSPKGGTRLAVTKGDELKVVWPQVGLPSLDALAALNFTHKFLSPQWCPNETGRKAYEVRALLDVLSDPRWRLTTQMHKHLGIQ